MGKIEEKIDLNFLSIQSKAEAFPLKENCICVHKLNQGKLSVF